MEVEVGGKINIYISSAMGVHKREKFVFKDSIVHIGPIFESRARSENRYFGPGGTPGPK